MALEKIVETDVMVIGGGMAGIFAAIKAREEGQDVTLVDKGYTGKSGATSFAGGYIVLFNEESGHSLNAWIDQVSKAGEYIIDRDWSEIVLRESYARYQDLVSWGVKFLMEDGKIHINRRGVLESVNMWRNKYHPVMRNRALESGVRMMDRVMVTDLLKQDGRIAGAVGFHTRNGGFHLFKAKAIVVAAGQGSFKQAGFPTHYWTGDGEGMAYRAGAGVTGKEFGGRGFGGIADYPAWRGHGMTISRYWKFINAEGRELDIFKSRYYGIEAEVHAGHAPVSWNLDAATPEEIKSMLEHQKITQTIMEAERAGIDVARGGKVPIVGAAWLGGSVQGGTGGLWPADKYCATTVPGLFAAGDSCATRQIGAIYPATGFALGNAAVTGTRAGLGAADYASRIKKTALNEAEVAKLKKVVYTPMERKGGFGVDWVTQQLQNTMVPYYMWQIKHEKRMQAALTIVEFLRNYISPKITARDAHELRKAHETRNMLLNAEMMLRASIFRTESRGTHYREDYPRRDDPAWLVWVKLKDEQGEMNLFKEPILQEWWPDLSEPYEERYPVRFAGE